MQLLILGGTRFVGRHLAEMALERGHRVTLLHRGRSAAGPAALLPGARHLIADRDEPAALAAALGGGRFDAVVDTCAYVPRQVHQAAGLLAGRTGRYLLVSSISVYADAAAAPLDESAPRAVLADPATEAVTGETYGGLKALCEDAALDGFGAAATLVLRPGLIVGPHDPTGRFSWWVRRLLRGGRVLAPGDPAAPVQFVDARDLAGFMLDELARGGTGVLNVAGPVGGTTMGRLLETARDTLNPAVELCWMDEARLLAAGVAPWMELPLWLPAAQAGLHRASIDRAVARGFGTRPMAETLRDTARWLATLPDADAVMPPPAPGGPPRPQPGLDPAREATLLQAPAGADATRASRAS